MKKKKLKRKLKKLRKDISVIFKNQSVMLHDGREAFAIYGIDRDILFANLIQKYGVVSVYELQDFIHENIDRFSDDDNVRHNAIERLGW